MWAPSMKTAAYARLATERTDQHRGITPHGYRIVNRGPKRGTLMPPSPDLVPGPCSIHGKECLGHMGYHGEDEVAILPATVSGGTEEFVGRYLTAAQSLVSNRITEEVHRDRVSKYMMTKGGAIRSVTSLCVEGSLRMVISPWVCGMEGTVGVPSCVASRTFIPDMSGGVVSRRNLRDGDYCVLVRYPCLWPGGAQIVKVAITGPDRIYLGDGEWDTNSTIKLPPGMCGPYAADYDGDEVSLFPITSHEAVNECKSYRWKYRNESGAPLILAGASDKCKLVPEDHASAFHAACICSTVSWRDVKRRIRLGEFHRTVGLKPRHIKSFNTTAASPMEFAMSGMRSMNSGALKSSMQSEIGAMSRRAKLSSELIHLVGPGVVKVHAVGGPRLVELPLLPKGVSVDATLHTAKYGWYGIPVLRAISKLCSTVMQTSLKVKTSDTVTADSPTMSLLQGSSRWLVIRSDGEIEEACVTSKVSYANIRVSCNLYSIKMAPESMRWDLCVSFVRLCMAESGLGYDYAEQGCLELLCYVRCVQSVGYSSGLQLPTLKRTEGMDPLTSCSSHYYDRKYIVPMSCSIRAETYYQRMFLSDYSSLVSMMDTFK